MTFGFLFYFNNIIQIKIDDAGDYELTLFTMGLNEFHFPFSIRSIVVEG